MNQYMHALKNYAKFSGRAGKSEFWYFVLINLGVSILLTVIGGMIKFPMLGGLYNLAITIPTLAVGVRRMHDIGKDWWYYFIPFYNLYLALQPSENGTNKYGPEPVKL